MNKAKNVDGEIGTPHRGSSTSTLASTIETIVLLSIPRAERSRVMMHHLVRETEYYQDINMSFRRLGLKYDIASIFEEKTVPALGKVSGYQTVGRWR